MPRVLLTGYGGFLGAEIARQLIASGYEVRGIARQKYPELEALGVEAVQGDITSEEVVAHAIANCEAVIHTAAKAGVWGTWEEYFRINTAATSQLLRAAQHNQVRAMVYTSSPSVTFDGQHQSGVDESVPYPERWLCYYPQTKALAEKEVLEAAADQAISTCALRPHLIWGHGDPHLFPRVVERTLQGKLRRVGDGKNLIDVVHVQSAARAHVQALDKLLDGDQRVNGQAFFLTDGEPIECWQWISKILECAGVPVPDKSISFNSAYRVGAALETIYWLARKRQEPPMTRFVAAQLALDHYFSIDKARELLDYQTVVNREEEFERCRPWLQELARSH